MNSCDAARLTANSQSVVEAMSPFASTQGLPTERTFSNYYVASSLPHTPVLAHWKCKSSFWRQCDLGSCFFLCVCVCSFICKTRRHEIRWFVVVPQEELANSENCFDWVFSTMTERLSQGCFSSFYLVYALLHFTGGCGREACMRWSLSTKSLTLARCLNSPVCFWMLTYFLFRDRRPELPQYRHCALYHSGWKRKKIIINV